MGSYDAHADAYAASIQSRDAWGFSPYLDLVVPALVQVLGDVQGKRLLDACCGEGYLARLLASLGAQVAGVDISAQLVGMAREREAQERRGISYLVHDLTRPLPQYEAQMDAITCNLALNDVIDYRPFVANLAAVLRPQGVLAISLNNPYSAVIRGKVERYFESGQARTYSGLAAAGVPALYHHRTLEEYFVEFARHGLWLRMLSDVKPSAAQLASGSPRPKAYYRFPFFMVLELVKAAGRQATVDRGPEA